VECPSTNKTYYFRWTRQPCYIRATEHVNFFELNMITLPPHTLNALQPLNVSYLKSSKITFRNVRDVAMFKNNHMELNKIILAR
jgi:hypothetical protein